MIFRFLPVIVFLLLAALFAIPLFQGKDPSVLDSALVGQSMPSFKLAGLSADDLKGKVVLVNFFASWCVPCAVEQPVLTHIQREKTAQIYGISYKDRKEDTEKWLKENGNPFTALGYDFTGKAAIDWGVYGVPESFIIDRKGVVRYRHAGPMTMADYVGRIKPMLEELAK